MLEKWNREDDPVASLKNRSRFERLYELLKAGNVEIKVVSRDGRAVPAWQGGRCPLPGWQQHLLHGVYQRDRPGLDALL